jgi:hypothetical protein
MKIKISIILLFNLSIFCKAQDVIYKYPNNNKIRDYVSCIIKITSIREEGFIIPSYELILRKQINVQIKELEVRANYYYGQNFDYTNSHLFVLDEEQIKNINATGTLIIKKIFKNGKENHWFLINCF